MKNIAILALLVFASVQGFAQTEAELTPEGKFGRKILMENGIKTECYSIAQTPQGLFISTRTEANVPVNYLYTEQGTFSKVDKLNGYIVFAFSPLKNDLLVGKYEYGNVDSMCREVYTYNTVCKTFIKQFNLGWIYMTPTFTKYYDSIVVVVNEKSPDGIGSQYSTKTVKAKL